MRLLVKVVVTTKINFAASPAIITRHNTQGKRFSKTKLVNTVLQLSSGRPRDSRPVSYSDPSQVFIAI